MPGFLLMELAESKAQNALDNIDVYVISPIRGHHVDYTIPVNDPVITHITFTLDGGDGGSATIDEYTSNGGQGAKVMARFEVGNGPGQIPVGSTLRYMVGIKGTSTYSESVLSIGFVGAGGGGGSGVWYAPPGSNNFTLLAVAGGGGGAYMGTSAGEQHYSAGLSGEVGTNGGKGRGTGANGGTNGQGGGGSGLVAGGGGGLNTPGGGITSCGGGGAGGVTGGLGGSSTGCTGSWGSGGSGVGGGGAGYTAGGGGGGYSGGGAGSTGGGGGGGSYVAPFAISSNITVPNPSSDLQDGSITFKYTLNKKPLASCKNADLFLDSYGEAILPYFWVNSSFDPDGSLTNVELSKYEYTCADVGEQKVVVTVTDNLGAMDQCTATVYVIDITPPVVQCNDITVELNMNGQVSILPQDVDVGSTDNCGIDTIYLNKYDFTCEDVGEKVEVTLTVMDVNGNSNSCNAIITVVDRIVPTVSTRDIEVSLNSSGYASIVPADINNGSWDACGIDTMYLDRYDFSCDHVGEEVVVTLTVVDINGNTNSNTATVSVLDNIPPTAITQDIEIYLNSSGNVSIVTSDIDYGSWDACGIDTMYLDVYEFTCANLGTNTVILTVKDIYQNTASASAVVTVIDRIKPVVKVRDVTVVLDKYSQASVRVSDIDAGSWDNCNIVNRWLEGLISYDCGDTGSHLVTLFVQDQSGNVESEVAEVTVKFYEPDFSNIRGVMHGDTVHLVDCLPWPSEITDLINHQKIRNHGTIAAVKQRMELPDNPPWSMYELWRYEYRFKDGCFHTRTFTFYLALYDLNPPGFHSFPPDITVATVADVPEIDRDVRIIDICQYVVWDTVITFPVRDRSGTDTLGFTRRWIARDRAGHQSFRDQMIWLDSGNRNDYGMVTGRIVEENQILRAQFAGEAGSNGLPVSLYRIGEESDGLIWVDTWTTGDWQGAQGNYYFEMVPPGRYQVKIDTSICLVDTLNFDQHLWSDTLDVSPGEVIDLGWIVHSICMDTISVMHDTIHNVLFDTIESIIEGSIDTLKNQSANTILADTAGFIPPVVQDGGDSQRTEPVEWSIYPNPTRGYVHIRVNTDNQLDFRVFDPRGRLVKQGIFQSGQSIGVGELSSGLYYVQLRMHDHLLGVKKIMIME